VKDPKNPEHFVCLEKHFALGFSPDSKTLVSLQNSTLFFWQVGEEFTRKQQVDLPHWGVTYRLWPQYRTQAVFAAEGSLLAVPTRVSAPGDSYSDHDGGPAQYWNFTFLDGATGKASTQIGILVDDKRGVGTSLASGFLTPDEFYCFLPSGHLRRWQLTKAGNIEKELPKAQFGSDEQDLRAARLLPGTRDQFVTVQVYKDEDKVLAHFDVARWKRVGEGGKEMGCTEQIELADSDPRFTLATDCSRVAVTSNGFTIAVYAIGDVLGLPKKE
jgi:hypothetical protein